jgi:hypothetical protein
MTKPETSAPREFVAVSRVTRLPVGIFSRYFSRRPSCTIVPAAFWWMTTTSKSDLAAPPFFCASSFS